MNEVKQGYNCKSCGKYHEGLPLSYAAEMPEICYSIEEQEIEKRVEITSDLCVVDEKHFFILGNVEIPIINSDKNFIWSVWVSLSKTNFEKTCKFWEEEGREKEPPYFGWFSTQLYYYPDTLNLKTLVHTRPVGTRPYIELELTDHPLSLEQHNGISWSRIQEIAESIFHG